VLASGPLEAGRPVRLTLIVLADEGAFSGYDVTLPASFVVTATAAPSRMAVAVSAGRDATVLRVSGATVAAGTSIEGTIDGTPRYGGALHVDITSHLTSGRDYVYPPITVQVGGARAPRAPGGTAALPLTAGLLAGGALLTGGYAVTRRRRTARAATLQS